jgi:hypothetical protein
VSFKTDLRTAILNIPAVVAIVGEGTIGHVWDGWPRTTACPCIVMELDDEEEQNYLDTGKGTGQVGSLVLTCRAETPEQADSLRTALRSGLVGLHSTTFDLVINSIAESQVEKQDSSVGHYYDRVFDCTAIWTET